jgi:hypothetical protein
MLISSGAFRPTPGHHADLSGRAAENDKTRLEPVKKASRKKTGNDRPLTVSEMMDIEKH